MSRFPWRDTSEDIASQSSSQWETPDGAQAKANKALEDAEKYTNEKLGAHIGSGGDAHALAVPDGSAGFISGSDQAKLDGIQSGAEVNQNAFSAINGISASMKEDTVNFEAGVGISIATNPTSKKIRVTATGTSTPGAHGIEHVGDGIDPIPIATETESGLMSASDKKALNETVSGLTDLAGVGRITETVKENADAIAFVSAQMADLAYNVKKYGAKGNGSSDDTAAIQAAIDAAAANKGGTVYFPKGTYIIKNTLQYREKVNLVGCASRFCSNLVWNSETSGVILDTTNVSITQSVFENLAFYRGAAAKSTGALVTGILGGSNYNIYNSCQGIFRNLLFHDLEYGIRGNGVLESSDIDAIGLFDCNFENVWCSNNSVGLWIHGSANAIINPRFSGCGIGLYLDYLSRQSQAGAQLFGGVFAGNGYDISIPDVRGIRSCSFFGVWFETSTSGIINIPLADTFVGAMGFKNCVLSSNAPSFGLANFYNSVGVINIEGCNIIQSGSSDVSIVRPNKVGSKLKISNSWEKLSNGTERLLDDNAIDQKSYVHVFQSVIQAIPATTFTTVNFDNKRYDNQSEYDLVSDRFVCKSSGIYQVFASVRLENQPSGNRALLALYANGASEIVLYDEINGASGVSALSGSAMVLMQKGDYLELRIHSANAVNAAAGAYNSNYLQISKVSE